MKPIVGIQGYIWHQIFHAQQKDHNDHLEEILPQLKSCGVEGYEQGLMSEQQAQTLKRLLEQHGVKMPSIYAGAPLHTPEWKAGVDRVLMRAQWAQQLGTALVTVNPDPIAWGKPFNKTDDQLKVQAKALQMLGERLSAMGMGLAYHTHDPEMRCAAREFHHMLQATDPKVVGLCLDAHWIYRGAENSQIALDDIIKMYLPRIRSLHLRQSHGGVWSEVLENGDIDYAPLVVKLKEIGFKGPIIMEQAREEDTPATMTPLEAIRRGREWVREAFGA